MIRVNGKEFDATTVFATDGSLSMTIETTEKLSVIEGYFPAECVIEVIENEELTAKYYNKEVLSLKVENGEKRAVTVVFKVSEIQQSAEDKLSERADTSDGAIEELAGLVAEQMETVAALTESKDSIDANVAALETRIAALEKAAEKGATNG